MSAFDGFRFSSFLIAVHCSSVRGGIGSGSIFFSTLCPLSVHSVHEMRLHCTLTYAYGTCITLTSRQWLKRIMEQTFNCPLYQKEKHKRVTDQEKLLRKLRTTKPSMKVFICWVKRYLRASIAQPGRAAAS
jgi:hypothetical protein